jgi:TPP-dependent pyruvate/acetoin dehydrogenase alpha subunit
LNPYPASLNPEIGRRLLRDMIRIRRVEETIAERYGEQQMRCPTHLSIGQEAPAAAAGAVLKATDLAVSGHRAHAHYLAKGGNLRAMIAELYGKATGCSGGKGGSMHLIDEAAGFMGSTAIVGGTVPVGVGLALARALAGTGEIVCIFIGDAVLETGAFYESANFAATHRLPVLFLCENNLYSVYSPLEVRQPQGRSLAKTAAALGLHATEGDGNDMGAAYDLVRAAAERLRAGEGPQFVELATYRWREHCGPNYDNDIGYRTEAEFEAWRARDPITLFSQRLLREDVVDQPWIDTVDAGIGREIDDAFAFARTSPFPDPAQAFSDLYSPEVTPSP